MLSLPAGAATLAEEGQEIVLGGPDYLEVLKNVHANLRPRTYLEIGTWQGASLRLAQCASLAIDTDFQLEAGVIGSKPLCVLQQTTSDSFFARSDPVKFLGQEVDFAFLDALHVFEFVLRDFIHTERFCARASVIALHDICPLDMFMTRPSYLPDHLEPTKYTNYWTGDVWKMIPVLREYRPHLRLDCLDAKPTGLAMCSQLDPSDQTLSDKYSEIVERWAGVSLRDYGMARLLADCQMVSSRSWVVTLTAGARQP